MIYVEGQVKHWILSTKVDNAVKSEMPLAFQVLALRGELSLVRAKASARHISSNLLSPAFSIPITGF